MRETLEIQRCSKCGKEFTEYPALSREDNKTEFVWNVESRKLFLLLLV